MCMDGVDGCRGAYRIRFGARAPNGRDALWRGIGMTLLAGASGGLHWPARGPECRVAGFVDRQAQAQHAGGAEGDTNTEGHHPWRSCRRGTMYEKLCR